MEASPNRSARLAAHAQQQSLQHTSFFYFVPSSMSLFYTQPSKAHAFTLHVTNDRRSIQLSFSYTRTLD
jgi:hypothetical protein